MGLTEDMKKSKKGSYIVEASVVLPIIILVTITIVLIIMFFYSQMAEQSRMHVFLRCEAGVLSEKNFYVHDANWDGEMHSKKGLTEFEIYGKKYLIMDNKGMLSKKGVFIIEDRCRKVDGAKYVRYCNFIKGKGDEE